MPKFSRTLLFQGKPFHISISPADTATKVTLSSGGEQPATLTLAFEFIKGGQVALLAVTGDLTVTSPSETEFELPLSISEEYERVNVIVFDKSKEGGARIEASIELH